MSIFVIYWEFPHYGSHLVPFPLLVSQYNVRMVGNKSSPIFMDSSSTSPGRYTVGRLLIYVHIDTIIRSRGTPPRERSIGSRCVSSWIRWTTLCRGLFSSSPRVACQVIVFQEEGVRISSKWQLYLFYLYKT